MICLRDARLLGKAIAAHPILARDEY